MAELSYRRGASRAGQVIYQIGVFTGMAPTASAFVPIADEAGFLDRPNPYQMLHLDPQKELTSEVVEQ
eukprot:3948681-Prorocentrum_lima.AAC.1